jgi:hypothetical protein
MTTLMADMAFPTRLWTAYWATSSAECRGTYNRANHVEAKREAVERLAQVLADIVNR